MRFQPERFNTSDPNNEWLLTTEGKPRNPFSYQPFTGGKRVCLGKTFAEVVTKYTIPLLFLYFDFAFEDHVKQSAEKHPYSLSGLEELPMKLKMTTRLEVGDQA